MTWDSIFSEESCMLVCEREATRALSGDLGPSLTQIWDTEDQTPAPPKKSHISFSMKATERGDYPNEESGHRWSEVSEQCPTAD